MYCFLMFAEDDILFASSQGIKWCIVVKIYWKDVLFDYGMVQIDVVFLNYNVHDQLFACAIVVKPF